MQALVIRIDHFSLTNVLAKKVILTAGILVSTQQCTGEVYQLGIKANTWKKLPALNVPRYDHASTSLD